MSEQETTVGKRVLRKEDFRLITGEGSYTDDINLPNQTYAYFVRSPMARAGIKGIDLRKALQSEGVVDILTGQQLAEDGLGALPCGWMVLSADGSEMKQPAHPVLANDKVNYVGEPLAIVLAESKRQAKDAAELVEVDYEELPVLTNAREAAVSDIQLYDEIPGNRSFNWELGEKEATDKVFESADHIVSMDIYNNRLIPNAMEPRAAIGDYSRGNQDYTLYTTSQNPHVARLVLTAFVQIAPEHKLRVIAPDVGGGFGSKIYVYSEETACLWAASKIARPVKWTADRSESFLTDAHGRDHHTHGELALSADGTFEGLRIKTIANVGAYLSLFASAVPTYLYGTLLAGQYKTPNVYVEVDSIFTNTAPVDAYRGAGRPEATYILERLVEKAARSLSMDPSEIRRKNFIQPEDFPYQTPVALEYDIGNYEASLDRAMEMAAVSDFDARRADSQARGKLRGLGYSCYIEACGIAPSKMVGELGAGVGLWESGEVRVNATGSVTVLTGAHSHGQGHETTFAQIVADRFGIDIDDVEVVHGDTGRMDMGMGTYGSRSLAVGGSALDRASDKIIAKGLKIAAHLLGVSEEEIEFKAPEFKVKNSNAAKTFQEIAFAAYVPHDYPDDLEPGLAEKAFYDPQNFTYPAGCYICEVEIDPATGVTSIEKFTAVDDFGKIINPMIVEGQVHGGLVQGIGQAMLENCVYDENGQLLSGSYMDYCMPRADDFPNFDVDLTETACTHNPLGVKGCGEAGAIGSPPAVINAITDALGILDMDMPATPYKIWQIISAQEGQ
ncbi:MAG: xanthine dehydrogenase family protein molybdopterin-binding subunit [bacterium]|nr:xanthine dehydrogenase family protein molybdopterin-binding subunit [Gammaproteobacteria bacterium]